MSNSSYHRLACIFVFLFLTSTPAAAEWWNGFGPSGVDGAVYCMASRYEELLVGGLFDKAGGVPAANFAWFDDRRWRDIHGGTDGAVLAIFANDYTITIGGTFWEAGGRPCAHVADLEEGGWCSMGDGLPEWPNNFLVHNTVFHACGKIDSDGDWLYSIVARWDGLAWHDLWEGSTLVNEGHCMAHYDGSLFIGGDFRFDAFDPDILNFTEWDGEDFRDFGFGSGETINALQVRHTGIYIGGDFGDTGVTESWGLVFMSGARTLHPVQQAHVPRTVVALDVWRDCLIVGQSDAVIPYGGYGWGDTLGGVLDGNLNALYVIGLDLYASGSFPGSVARWDNLWDEWVQLGGSPGIPGSHERSTVRALCRYDGRLVAAGMDLIVPSILQNESHCHNIGIWDGEAWHRMGGGFNSTVHDLAVYGGDLYAGGHFDYADGAPADHLACWDGETWQDVGGANADVNALVVWNGELIAGGDFNSIDGVLANRVAAWDGATWRALGAGLGGPVNDLVVHEGELYAGGVFHDTANRVARWDGAQWQSLGAGTDNIVHTLGSHGGDLYAGGYFTHAGGMAASRIARWDGAVWHALGDGLGGEGLTYFVRTMKSIAGKLYVGGDFTEAGGLPASAIATWDGASWSEYEGGVQDGFWRTIVYDMQIHEGDLYLGGDFAGVGGSDRLSVNLARWVDGSLVGNELKSFDAAWSGTRVDLVWRVTEGEGPDVYDLRGRAGPIAWTVPYTAVGEGCFTAHDAPPRGGPVREAIYELSYLDADSGQPVLLASRAVDLPPVPATCVAGAHPNPFNPGTTISFTLARAGRVRLGVYDATGRLVAVLADRPFAAGDHEAPWDGRDDRGRAAPSGTYLVRLEAEDVVESAKIVLLR